MPIDAACAHEQDVHEELIDVAEVFKRMEQPDRTSLVLLDACRDNPLAQNLARAMGFSDTKDASVGAGLAEQTTREGTLIAFATQPGHIAYEGRGRNSYFTQAILEQIDAAPQRDVELLMRDVRVRVRARQRLAAVKEKHARQQQAAEKRSEVIADALTEHGVGETEAVRVLAGKGRDDREVWIAPGSGESFRDAASAPEMVVVPAAAS
ncbi:MAG: caspase family protein [Dichotomicrobium sp.]